MQLGKVLQVAPGCCYSQKPHHCLAVPEAALDEGEGEGSCNAEDILAEAGAGRKSSSSFTGIPQAFPQNPLGTRFQGSPLNPGLTPEWTNRVTSSRREERCLCEVCLCSLLIFQSPLDTSPYWPLAMTRTSDPCCHCHTGSVSWACRKPGPYRWILQHLLGFRAGCGVACGPEGVCHDSINKNSDRNPLPTCCALQSPKCFYLYHPRPSPKGRWERAHPYSAVL